MLRWFKQPITLLRIYSGAVPTSGRRGLFSPAHFTLWHLQTGGFDLEVEGKRLALTAPERVLLPPVPRRQVAREGTRLFSVHFKMENLALARLDWPSVLPIDRTEQFAAMDAGADRLMTALQTAGLDAGLAYLPEVPVDWLGFLQIQSAFLDLLHAASLGIDPNLLAIRERPLDARVMAVRRILQNSSVLALPDLESLAAAQGLSLRHLNRLHREAFGKTCPQFLDELRMDAARAGLANPQLTVKAVAHHLGFTDLSAFSNWFRKQELCSPREFRKRLQLKTGED